jgi:hypothetical protein
MVLEESVWHGVGWIRLILEKWRTFLKTVMKLQVSY